MSVPHRSCTCEARSVSVPTPLYILEAIPSSFQRLHILEVRFSASMYWKRISTPHILEARL